MQAKSIAQGFLNGGIDRFEYQRIDGQRAGQKGGGPAERTSDDRDPMTGMGGTREGDRGFDILPFQKPDGDVLPG